MKTKKMFFILITLPIMVVISPLYLILTFLNLVLGFFGNAMIKFEDWFFKKEYQIDKEQQMKRFFDR